MPLINHNEKFIFLHIPRTGGCSLTSCLKNKSGTESYKKHPSLNFLLNRASKKTGVNLEEYFKFSFVRNPWDIMISKYLAPCYKEINSLSGKSLLFFLDNIWVISSECGHSFHDYCDPEKLDFIGRFENRNKDLGFISKKIGIQIDPDVNVRQKQMQAKLKKKKHYSEYYDEQTLNIVYGICKKDIDYFGYKFGE